MLQITLSLSYKYLPQPGPLLPFQPPFYFYSIVEKTSCSSRSLVLYGLTATGEPRPQVDVCLDWTRRSQLPDRESYTTRCLTSVRKDDIGRGEALFVPTAAIIEGRVGVHPS